MYNVAKSTNHRVVTRRDKYTVKPGWAFFRVFYNMQIKNIKKTYFWLGIRKKNIFALQGVRTLRTFRNSFFYLKIYNMIHIQNLLFKNFNEELKDFFGQFSFGSEICILAPFLPVSHYT